MNKKAAIATAVILLMYFIFTSGFIFEVTKSESIDMLETPYSIALSNNRTRVIGVNNNDDVIAAKWVLENTDEGIPIHVDYCGTSLILDISDMGRNTCKEPEGFHYLFLTTWNTEKEQMVYGWYEGLREHRPLPELNGAVEVFRSGNAVVYEIGDK